MSDTSTVVSTEEDLLSSSLLGSSVGSLSAPRKSHHSEHAKKYKQASNFFLTRRFPEAYSIVRSLIGGEYDEHEVLRKSSLSISRPIETFDKKLRIRVLSLYLTLINAIVDLPATHGREKLGKRAWDGIRAKVENGSIWEEIVSVGYDGDTARVDADVVMNLTNLLLAQSKDTKTLQSYIEDYLSAPDSTNGTAETYDSSGRKPNGTSLVHDLETEIQILELYTLHVLPRNDDWQYARDFIRMSSVLDEERKEVFLDTLDDLERQHDADDEEKMSQKRLSDASLPVNPSLNGITRTDSEMTIRPEKPAAKDVKKPVTDTNLEPQISEPLQHIPPEPSPEPPSSKVPPRYPHNAPRPLPNFPKRNSNRQSPSDSIITRGMNAIGALQKVFSNSALYFSQNPSVLLQFVFFLLTLLAVLSRRNLRERIRRVLGSSWDKVKQTAGMGAKVSYI